MKAVEKILNKNAEDKFICVGLDSDLKKIPSFLLNEKEPLLKFNELIINATKESAAAYKINFAFYERNGAKGFEILEKTVSQIPEDILIIADAKRGDIGNTSEMYAQSVYDHFNFDSVTLHPYMGKDSLQPFLDYDNKMNFVLALTSNPGSVDFEKLKLADGKFLFQKVIEEINNWNVKKNCGIVFGATNPDELKDNLHSFGELSVLLPGVGAQGGSLEDVIMYFKKADRKNFLINISRGIIYKSSGNDFDIAARGEILKLNSEVKKLL